MQRLSPWLVVLVMLMAGLGLAGCQSGSTRATPLFNAILNSSQEIDPYNGYTAPIGTTFMVADVSFENVTDQQQTLRGPLFDLTDNSGQHFSESPASNPNQVTDVDAGASVELQFAFAVPSDDCHFTLTLTGVPNATNAWTINCTTSLAAPSVSKPIGVMR